MANKSRHTKQQGHTTDPSRSRQRQKQQRHRESGHAEPEPVATKNPIPPSPSWSPMTVTQNFAYSVLQSPDGQPISWKISGPAAIGNTYNAMPRNYAVYPPPPNPGAAPAWTGTTLPASSYAPLTTPYSFPPAAITTQSLSGSTVVDVSTSAADPSGGEYAQSEYTQVTGGSDVGADDIVVTVADSDEGDDESGDDCEYAPPPSKGEQRKTKKPSSSSRRSHHSRESDRYQRHSSRSAAAPRMLTREEYRQAEREALSWHIVGEWLADGLRPSHY